MSIETLNFIKIGNSPLRIPRVTFFALFGVLLKRTIHGPLMTRDVT